MPKVKRVCVGCGSSYKTNKSTKIKYCSKKCYLENYTPWNKGMKGFLAGEKHWKYGKKFPGMGGVKKDQLVGNTNGFKKGHVPWNNGKKWNEETKNKMRGRRPNTRGENNHNWKDGKTTHEKVSYRNLHRWVERYLGKPDICEHCEKTELKGRQIHWANISSEYKRELEDWIRLCAKCHKKYDGTSIRENLNRA